MYLQRRQFEFAVNHLHQIQLFRRYLNLKKHTSNTNNDYLGKVFTTAGLSITNQKYVIPVFSWFSEFSCSNVESISLTFCNWSSSSALLSLKTFFSSDCINAISVDLSDVISEWLCDINRRSLEKLSKNISNWKWSLYKYRHRSTWSISIPVGYSLIFSPRETSFWCALIPSKHLRKNRVD